MQLVAMPIKKLMDDLIVQDTSKGQLLIFGFVFEFLIGLDEFRHVLTILLKKFKPFDGFKNQQLTPNFKDTQRKIRYYAESYVIESVSYFSGLILKI